MSDSMLTYQCTMIKQLGTVTVMLRGAEGDIYQTYMGSDMTTVTPDLEATGLTDSDRPVAKTVLMCSNPAVSATDLAGMIMASSYSWYWNGRKIHFGSDGKSTGLASTTNDSILDSTTTAVFAGMFKIILPADSNPRAPYGGLMICKNYVAAALGTPPVVRAVFQIKPDQQSQTLETMQADMPLQIIQRQDGTAAACSIYCDPGQSFNLSETNQSVTAKVKLWAGADLSDTPIGSDHSVKWYLLDAGGWQLQTTGVVGNTFSIDRDMIAVTGTVKVEILLGTQVLCADTQSITDESDAWEGEANPTPADGVFNYNDPAQTGVTFAPKLKNRKTGNYTTAFTYSVVVMTPGGVILNNTSLNQGMASNQTYTVTKQMFDDCEGDAGPVVIIAFTLT